MQIASISIDLDNFWAYLKGAGIPNSPPFPSFLEIYLPKMLDLLDTLTIKTTFFVVAQDVKNRDVYPYIGEITARGHAVGNHSFFHNTHLNRYTETQIVDELKRADEAIWEASDQKPIGFRGPGFTKHPSLIQSLQTLDYLYDSTSFPTFFAPLLRRVHFLATRLPKEQRRQQNRLFGSWMEGFHPLHPHKVAPNFFQFPVSTLPYFKLPLHMSYLHFLAQKSERAMERYFLFATTLLHWTKTDLNFLLHPTDLLGGDAVNQMHHFPGMQVKTAKKEKRLIKVLTYIKKHFTLKTLEQRARTLIS